MSTKTGIDEWDDALDGLAAAATPPDEPPPLVYGSVDEFVREYLITTYRRVIAGTGQGAVWAANWWDYDEAVIRLTALWRSWEQLRLDPATGMSVWWKDHADHHMAVLLDSRGPFANSDSKNRTGEPLPYTPPPPGMFPDERLAAPGEHATTTDADPIAA